LTAACTGIPSAVPPGPATDSSYSRRNSAPGAWRLAPGTRAPAPPLRCACGAATMLRSLPTRAMTTARASAPTTPGCARTATSGSACGNCSASYRPTPKRCQRYPRTS
jgi:hypothetical protein